MLTLPMFYSCSSLILASSSPRRQQFLTQLGLVYKIIPAHIDETHQQDELPKDYVLRMAVKKAMSVAKAYPEAWVIGADTVITIDGKNIVGKPSNDSEAMTSLKQLRNRTHQVLTGLCLHCENKAIRNVHVEKTDVTFVNAPEEILEAYVRTGEPIDKAGAYGIQGIGSVLVKEINGSCTNVIGLPLSRLISLLLQYKVIATTFQNTAR